MTLSIVWKEVLDSWPLSIPISFFEISTLQEKVILDALELNRPVKRTPDILRPNFVHDNNSSNGLRT